MLGFSLLAQDLFKFEGWLTEYVNVFYWNQKNFEGLKHIAEAYKEKRGYEDFVEYCIKKEQGLRKQANLAIGRFVSKVASLPIERQREIALEFAELNFYNSEVHQLLSHPIYSHVHKVLSVWSENEDAPAEVFRWLATMGAGMEYYESALERNPKDEISIYKLAVAHINDVNFQTHHLGESRLIGTMEELEDSLGKSIDLYGRLNESKEKAALSQEIEYYKSLVNSWKKYSSKEREESFVEWFSKKGLMYDFPSVVYYSKR